MKQPHAFKPGQAGSYRPAPTAKPILTHIPPAPEPGEPEPLISVFLAGFWRVSKSFMRAAGITPGQYVRLVPPRPAGSGPRRWYLESRPRPGDGQRLPAKNNMRVQGLAKQDFQRPNPEFADRPAGINALATIANKNSVVPVLYLRLGPEVPGHPGYFELLRVRPPKAVPSPRIQAGSRPEAT